MFGASTRATSVPKFLGTAHRPQREEGLMEHVVFHPGPDGSPAFRRFASLEDAVRYVEHLRNSEGVSEVSVHALTPVPVAFRAYYKVEVPVEDAAAVAPAAAVVEAPVADVPVADVPVAEVPAAEVPVAELPVAEVPAPSEPVAGEQVADLPVAEPVAEPVSNGRRSLGFFAH
jgi:hypothetical protein